MLKLVDKTLEEIIYFLRRVFESEQYSRRKGFLQNYSPQIRISFLAFMTIITIFLKDIEAILLTYFISLLIAKLSNINLREFILKTWLFIPLYTFIISIPMIFNLITPGSEIFHLAFFNLYITYEGVIHALKFTLRTATALSFIILITSTSTWIDISQTLTKIHIPTLTVMLLNMTYRYIFLFIETTYKMLLALKSRLNSSLTWRENLKIGSKLIGNLFIKTYYTGERVYLSMLSRGFDNDIYIHHIQSLEKQSILSLLVLIILSTLPIVTEMIL